MNRMSDLRREVAERLRHALHGREVDTLENEIRLPHMLGITPLNKIHDPRNEEGTLLDPNHDFWSDYDGSVDTPAGAAEEIRTAIHSLKQDGTFRMTHPYGEEADIVYIEVDRLSPNAMTAECDECGATIEAVPSLDRIDRNEKTGFYNLRFSLDCPKCDFSAELASNTLTRL